MEAPYDSPFWAIEGEVIPEVANSKEGLVTPEGWEGELFFFFENLLVHVGNWTRVTRVKCQSANHYTIQALVVEGDFNKVSYMYNKSSNFTNPSLPQIEMIDIGHKSLQL